MKMIVYILLWMAIPSIVVIAFESLEPTMSEVNLTDWREHRRKKRFILFTDAGILKLVCGIAFPVNLGEKKTWRQLVSTYNFQYQFPVPARPYYWWERWQRRSFHNDPTFASHPLQANDHRPEKQTDEAQLFIFKVVEQYMDRQGMPGRECLLKAICENAQIHGHQGLYAELLHRILRPHRNLEAHYVDAWQMGQRGVDCPAAYAEAQNCLLDKFIHVREDFMDQTSVK